MLTMRWLKLAPKARQSPFLGLSIFQWQGIHTETDFSNSAWGEATCSYTQSAGELAKVKAKFDAIVEEAQVYVKSLRHNRTSDGMQTQTTVTDKRACLVDNSDSDSKSDNSDKCLTSVSCLSHSLSQPDL